MCSRVRVWAKDNAVELQERYGFTAVDAAFVVRDAMYASPLHNLFAETQEAMMIVSLCVLWLVIACVFCSLPPRPHRVVFTKHLPAQNYDMATLCMGAFTK